MKIKLNDEMVESIVRKSLQEGLMFLQESAKKIRAGESLNIFVYNNNLQDIDIIEEHITAYQKVILDFTI